MDTITVNGLHKCQPKNIPEQGETKNMVVVNMPAKGDKKAWIKIKNELPDKGGTPYRILNVQPLDWPPDQYGNVAMNLEVEASDAKINTSDHRSHAQKSQGESSAFQQTKAAMQGDHSNDEDTTRVYDKGQHFHEPPVNEPQSPPARSNGDSGVSDARKHLMQSANLYNLCVSAVDKAIAPHMPAIAQTSEMFQAAVASLYIEASKDVWWSGKIVKESYLSKMPTKPIE